ncbi:hypothetical protein M885DRAFT_610239 [Pelagophyceae sp. CCMP2097]|nr:hypothetical protein M885DRAFT_610239 [Pelagophyceae sp. CCMP2097]
MRLYGVSAVLCVAVARARSGESIRAREKQRETLLARRPCHRSTARRLRRCGRRATRPRSSSSSLASRTPRQTSRSSLRRWTSTGASTSGGRRPLRRRPRSEDAPRRACPRSNSPITTALSASKSAKRPTPRADDARTPTLTHTGQTCIPTLNP